MYIYEPVLIKENNFKLVHPIIVLKTMKDVWWSIFIFIKCLILIKQTDQKFNVVKNIYNWYKYNAEQHIIHVCVNAILITVCPSDLLS